MDTTGEFQICEHLPQLAAQMRHLAIVRSMSTREADHTRGNYYLHTGFVPNPNVQHPSYGAVVAHELAAQNPELRIPPFVAIGGNSVGPGFLGMTWSPFVIESDGNVRNLETQVGQHRLEDRISALKMLERSFGQQNRGQAAHDHTDILAKTVEMMTSDQLAPSR